MSKAERKELEQLRVLARTLHYDRAILLATLTAVRSWDLESYETKLDDSLRARISTTLKTVLQEGPRGIETMEGKP